MNIDKPMTNTLERAPSPAPDDGPWRGAVVVALVTLLGLGFAYSLAGVGLGQLLFPQAANGSLVSVDGRIVGSVLVAQRFVAPGYFHARPSAANFDPMAAAGSNQARSNPALTARLAAEARAVAARDGQDPAAIPADLATQSGSGLDPALSPAAAHYQAARVAAARGLAVDAVHALIERRTEARQFGIFGERRVNVLELNVALDALHAGR